jgi:hypothetical protein
MTLYNNLEKGRSAAWSVLGWGLHLLSFLVLHSVSKLGMVTNCCESLILNGSANELILMFNFP